MPLNPVDTTTDHGTYKGDPAKTAFGKVNANDQYLEQLAQGADTKATAAKSVADAALPKSGGTVTGPINRTGVANQDMFRVQNTGTQNGIGGDFASWAGSRTPGLQVDAQLNTSAYMAVRVSHWGVKHLFGLDVYEGGSGAGAQTTVEYHFATGASRHRFIDNGSMIIAGTLTQNSDYRIKDEIETIDPQAAAASLRATRPVEYTDISDVARPRRSGYVADEHQAHFRLLVDGEKDAMREEMVMVGDTTPYAPGEEPPDYVQPRQELRSVAALQSVNYIGMVPYIHAGWIQHDRRIDVLEAERDELKLALSGLAERIAALESGA